MGLAVCAIELCLRAVCHRGVRARLYLRVVCHRAVP